MIQTSIDPGVQYADLAKEISAQSKKTRTVYTPGARAHAHLDTDTNLYTKIRSRVQIDATTSTYTSIGTKKERTCANTTEGADTSLHRTCGILGDLSGVRNRDPPQISYEARDLYKGAERRIHRGEGVQQVKGKTQKHRGQHCNYGNNDHLRQQTTAATNYDSEEPNKNLAIYKESKCYTDRTSGDLGDITTRDLPQILSAARDLHTEGKRQTHPGEGRIHREEEVQIRDRHHKHSSELHNHL